MSSIARTGATGGAGMLPELIAWSSSFALDKELAREDLLGSAAHVTMLTRAGLVPPDDGRVLRDALFVLLDEAERGDLRLPPGEEDIHMAVEAELGRRVGPVASRLHTARSRNDQVALDLRLHVREQAARTLREVCAISRELADRGARERDILLPAYTHRQRAQPVSLAFLFSAWATQLLRSGELVVFALEQANALPLGSGACSGTSLPIDRPLVARLLGFPRLTVNALDTVGDRDFALDWAWAAARVMLAVGRVAADVVDFSTQEFGFVRLDGEIAAGSSMMPQKRNPDIFELLRGKSARAVGNVVSLLTLVKGLASGYNRDLQEDRQPLLETGTLVRSALFALQTAMPHVHFDPERCIAGLEDGFTQATDLAEAMVRQGVAFRDAYKAVGELVRAAVAAKKPLAQMPLDVLTAIHPGIDASVLAVLRPENAVAAKESPGGTGPSAVAAQLTATHVTADKLLSRLSTVPPLSAIAETIRSEPLLARKDPP